MGVYGRLLGYVLEIKKELAIKVGLSLLVSATYIAQAILMAYAVIRIFRGGSVLDIAWQLVFVLLAIVVRSIVLRELEAYGKVMASRVKNKMRMFVFDKILRLGPGYVTVSRSGKISSLILDGIESLEPFLVNYVPQIATVFIAGTGVGIYLCSLDPVAGLVVVVSMVLCVGVPYLTIPLVNKNIVNYWSIYSTLTSQYIDAVQGMTTLKTLNATKDKEQELAKEASAFYKQAIHNTAVSLLNSGLMLVLASVTSGVTVVVAALRADTGIMPIAAVSSFLFLATECARPMIELNHHWHSSFLGLSIAKDLFALIDVDPEVIETPEPEKRALDEGLPSIALHNVSFSYGKGVQKALSSVSLDIRPGSTVAIAGRSGSGKSTLLNLLLRFYDAGIGEVLINDKNVRDFSIEYLRSKIAVVFQDIFLFCGTIAENICIARPEASIEEIHAAAKAAHAHEFIMSMPKQYDTVIGERGITLSGGEKQRLSIARAVLKDAPILLLDEATSSVDGQSETSIQAALESLTRHRTTIIVAHRLSTIRNADMIFVLDEGELVEQGDHEELLQANGAYASLVKAQHESAA